MATNNEKKPVIDAVNDAIGALSGLLASLRARARESAAEVKSSARTVKRDAVKAGRGAVKKGKKKAVAKIESVGNGLLDKATKVWHDITGSDDAADAAPGPRSASRSPKGRS